MAFKPTQDPLPAFIEFGEACTYSPLLGSYTVGAFP